MTGQTKDGKVVYQDLKVYMPMAAGFDRGNKMVFGAHKKTGYMVDTSLQPGQEKVEILEFLFPKDVKEIQVTVRLWHLPSSAAENLDKLAPDKDKFLFFEEKRLVKIN